MVDVVSLSCTHSYCFSSIPSFFHYDVSESIVAVTDHVGSYSTTSNAAERTEAILNMNVDPARLNGI